MENFWDITISDIIQAFASVCTLVLAVAAYRLSKRKTFSRIVLEKQFETVYRLRSALLETECTIILKTENYTRTRRGNLSNCICQNADWAMATLFDQPTLYTQFSIEDEWEFIKYANMEYIPDEIREVILKFKYKSLATWANYKLFDETSNYVIIGVKSLKESIDKNSKEYNVLAFMQNKLYPTFTEYYSLINEIFEVIETWYNRHDANILSFGFHRNTTIKKFDEHN